ncbi:hypothetical protein AB0E67_04305 [Streptomyces sp. NPDC032161]|uniref:hypothetical protein n=1 Tax=unclassified Streptomyces TaxID=2593676 RepID=UPI0033E9D096
MLQCTALTDIPEIDTLVALTTMPGGPVNPPDTCMDGYALCELGVHDRPHGEQTEHAARLWAVDPPATRDLWLFWTGTDHNTRVGSGEHRAYRLAELPPCPAVLRNLITGSRCPCALYDRHPAPHSWHITDPLRDLLVQQVLDGEPHTGEDASGPDGADRRDEDSTGQA